MGRWEERPGADLGGSSKSRCAALQWGCHSAPSLSLSRGVWVLQHYLVANSLATEKWHSATHSVCILELAPILISWYHQETSSAPPEPLLLTANHKCAKTGTQGCRGTLTLLLEKSSENNPPRLGLRFIKTMKFAWGDNTLCFCPCSLRSPLGPDPNQAEITIISLFASVYFGSAPEAVQQQLTYRENTFLISSISRI